MNKISKEFTIACYECDTNGLLKPSSFMDYAQEFANYHAESLGFGYETLIKSNTAWIISRMHIHFDSHPEWKDEVKFSTWHKGQDRLFYLRDFILADKEGRTRVRATTSWLILNLETRHLSRHTKVYDEEMCCRENAIEQPCDKIVMPKGIEERKIGERTVSYSDVDKNRHANNARYVAWVMDALDYDFMIDHPVSDVKINFNNEILPKETVEFFRADDGGRIYVEGRVGDKAAFCVEFSW